MSGLSADHRGRERRLSAGMHALRGHERRAHAISPCTGIKLFPSCQLIPNQQKVSDRERRPRESLLYTGLCRADWPRTAATGLVVAEDRPAPFCRVEGKLERELLI